MRSAGIPGIVLSFATTPAEAMRASGSCLDLLEECGGAEVSPTQGEQPFLTGNQCEAIKTRELRALLLEIPQEEENPMELSLGVKSNGGSLRFKIPFSF